jgi:hypothetical protein
MECYCGVNLELESRTTKPCLRPVGIGMTGESDSPGSAQIRVTGLPVTARRLKALCRRAANTFRTLIFVLFSDFDIRISDFRTTL